MFSLISVAKMTGRRGRARLYGGATLLFLTLQRLLTRQAVIIMPFRVCVYFWQTNCCDADSLLTCDRLCLKAA